MPPKRATTGASSRAKKSRPSDEGTGDEGPVAPALPRSKRWAPVSGSANAEVAFQEILQDPVTAFEFVCLCKPPFPTDADEDDDDDDDDDEEDEDEENDDPEDEDADKKTKCDGGKTCLCDKPATDHPDHVWTMSRAGKRKFFIQFTHFELRCPDNFGMYTFNDHMSYGILEMLQNLILDFEEAASNHKEQWAICEALAFFLKRPEAGGVTQADDGSLVDATYQLIGRLFLSMLARLEREKLLSKDSEIKNLGVVMALFMDFAFGSHDYGLLEESDKEPLGPAKDKKTWYPHAFDRQILAYARKYGIDLAGPSRIDEMIEEIDNEVNEDAEGDVDLPVPASNSTAKADPFGFAEGLKSYKAEHGGVTAFLAQTRGSITPIGGDNLDITTWTSAKRKAKAFDKKDPLGKREIEALKQGLVMSLG